NAASVNQDIDRLLRSGKFEDANASVAVQDSRAVVTFMVVERPLVTSVEIIGNQKFKTKDLLADTGLSAGTPISEYTIKKARDAIEQKYHDAGYYYIRVDLNADALRDGRVILTISEGPRVRIRHIVFEGNSSYSAFQLGGQIETKTYIWIFRKG